MLFLALRDLRRSARRFLLVGMVVALLAMLSSVLAALADGLVDNGISGLRALPITDLAFQTGADATFSRSILEPGSLEPWVQARGVEATPLGQSFVNAAPVGAGARVSLALFGVDPASFIAPHSGSHPLLGTSPGLVVSTDLVKQGVRVGQRYRLGGSNLTLPVLAVEPAGYYGHVSVAFTQLSTWQDVIYGNDAGGRFSAIALRLSSGTDRSVLAHQTGTQVLTKSQAFAGSPGFSAESATMTLIRGFLLVITALVVGAFFTVLVLQRTRQIGLLKAIGASNGYVLRDGLGQIAALVIAATLVGTALGALTAAVMAGGPVPIAVSPSGIAVSALLLVLAGLLGSAISFRRVAAIEPAIALGVEG